MFRRGPFALSRLSLLFAATVAVGLSARPATAQVRVWNKTAAGTYSWTDPTNWLNGVPNGVGAAASLTAATAGAQTLNLDAAVTLGQLTIGGANTYTVANGAGGSLTFNQAGGATLTVLAGTTAQAITATTTLSTDLSVVQSSASGQLSFGGALSGAGGFRLSGGGSVLFSGAAGYTGATSVSGGSTLVIGGTGGLLNATSGVTVAGNGIFQLDNSTSFLASRVGAATPVTLSGGFLQLLGNAGNNTDQSLGALALGGFSAVQVQGNAGSANTLRFASLARPSGTGSLFVAGSNLGAAAPGGVNNTNVLFTTAPTLTGGGGAAGSQTVSILPYGLGRATNAPVDLGNVSFLTYDATAGLRPLTDAEYVANTTYTGIGATVNFRQNNNAQLPAGTSVVNSWRTDTWDTAGAVAGSTLQVNSGAMLWYDTAGGRPYTFGVGATGNIPATYGPLTVDFNGQTAYLALTSPTNYNQAGGVGTGRELVIGARLTNTGAGGAVFSGFSNNFFRLANDTNTITALTVQGLNRTPVTGDAAAAGDRPFAVAFRTDGNLGAAGGAVTLSGAELRYSPQADASLSLNRPLTLLASGGILAVGSQSGDTTANASGAPDQVLSAGSPATAGSVLTWAGTITGPGGLTKSGPGTLTLTAANTYTGPTTVSAGGLTLSGGNNRLPLTTALSLATGTTLTISGGASQDLTGLTGAGAVATSAGGVLTVLSAADAQFDGVISGGGGLTKGGAGTYTLTATNTFTGPLGVTGGKLVTNPLTGGNAASVNGGAALTVVNSGGVTTTSLSSLSLGAGGGNSTLSLILSGAGNPAVPVVNVTGANGLTAAGTTTLNIDTTGSLGVGQFTLIDYSGTLGGNGFAGFTLGTLPSRVLGTLVNNAANTSVDLNVTGADRPIWRGNVNTNWDTNVTANWVLQSNTATATNFLAGDNALFNDTASSSGAVTVNLVGTLVPQAVTVDNPTRSYTFSGTGGIGGAGSLIKQGAGTLVIANSGANSFAGGTLVNAGTLQLGAGGTVGGVPGTVTLAGGTLAVSRSDNLTFANPVAGTGSFTKLGGNTLSVSSDFTFTGTTTISAGTLEIGAGGTTGTVSGAIANAATLNLNRSNDFTYAGVLSGAGTLNKLNANAVTLSGANTFSGPINIQGGRLTAGSPTAFGTTGLLTILPTSGASGIPADFEALRFVAGADATFNNPILLPFQDGGSAARQVNILTTANQVTTLAGKVGIVNPGGQTSSNITLFLNVTTSTDVGGLVFANGTNDFGVNRIQLNRGMLGIAANGAFGQTTTEIYLDVTRSASNGLTNSSSGLNFFGNNITVANPVTIADYTNINVNGNVAAISSQINALGDGGSRSQPISITSGNATTGTPGGQLTLSAQNFFTHGLDVFPNAKLVAGNVSALGPGTAGVNVRAGGTLALSAGGTYDAARPLTLNGAGVGAGVGALENLSGTNVFNNAVSLASTSNVGVTAGGLTLGGVVSGTGGLTKVGAGTLTLSGANTFTGPTVVSAGTLVVSAAAVATSPTLIAASGSTLTVPAAGLTLAANQTLGGNGTVGGGAVTVPSTAAVIAGGPLGTLTRAGGATTFQAGSGFRVALGGAVTAAGGGANSGGSGTAGTNNSVLAAGANSIAFGALNLTVDVTAVTSAFTPGSVYSFQVAGGTNNTPAGPGAAPVAVGTVTFLNNGIDVSNQFSSPTLVVVNGANTYLNFTPVPEPATVLLAAGLGLGTVRLVRRRLVAGRG